MFLKPTVISHLQAVLSLSLASTGATNFSLSWLDNLPSPGDPKLHDCMIPVVCAFSNTRPLIAEVLQWQGRYKEAISFAVAELQADFNFNAASKVRAGRVLGCCHAAIGEHALSVSALDAAIELARRGGFLLSEALAIRDRALAGTRGAGSGLDWDERTKKQRVEEVMGRMQGPREPLRELLRAPP
jgi:hypothetical protein